MSGPSGRIHWAGVPFDLRVGGGVTLTVIGVDGGPLPPGAESALAAAEVVVGAARHLRRLPVPAGAEQLVLGPVETALEKLAGRRSVVLASGDPGFFGIVRLLRARGHRPAVLPALSSGAAAFARIGLPWDDVAVVSAHGRALGPAVNVCRAGRPIAVLTAPGAGPAEIGAALDGLAADAGRRPRTSAAPDERMTTVPAGEAAARRGTRVNVCSACATRTRCAERGWLRRCGAGAAGRGVGRCPRTRSSTAPG